MAEFHVKTSEDGKLQGPFSSGQLKKLAGQGKLRPEHLVSRDGGASWHPATRVSGLEFSSPPPSPQTTPSSPQENSPAPKKLPSWVIVGGAIGVLCLVVIAGGVGFLIATGSGDDGSYPTIELDSSGELPSVDVLSDGPESVTGVNRAGTKGIKFVRVTGKAAGTSRGNEKLGNFKDFESFPEEYLGMFLKFTNINISGDFVRVTDPKDAGMFMFSARGPDGTSISSGGGTLFDSDSHHKIYMVLRQSFGRRLLSDFDADKATYCTIYCEIGLGPSYDNDGFSRVARTYKIETHNKGGGIFATHEDK